MKLLSFLVWSAGLGVGALSVSSVLDLYLQSRSPVAIQVKVPVEPGLPVLENFFAIEKVFGLTRASGPKLSLSDISLMGVISGVDRSVIAFQYRNGPTQVIQVGKTSSEGILFKGVFEGHVVMRSGDSEIMVPSTPIKPLLTTP